MGNHIKPRLALLTEDQIARIHAASLQILATTGIRVDSGRARGLLTRADGVLLDDDRVRLPPELVAWALATAPTQVALYDRRSNFTFSLGGPGAQDARFGIGVTNLYYQDPATDDVLPFTREHMAISVRLGETLASYDVVSTIGVLQDMPPASADLYATLEMTANTAKPLVLLVSEPDAFESTLDLLEGLHGDLAARPFVVPYFNPISPLVINSETSDKMFTAIGRGLPIIYSSYGMAGATTPITPSSTLVLLNAELLAGLVLSQLIREGAPTILGMLPAGFDMRAMLSYYGPDTMLLNLACAEMMAHYGLPHCGTSGSGAGWGADLPASDLLWMNHLTSCMGPVGLAPFVGGNFDSLAFSPALVVYADHIIRQARRLAKGFELNDATIALDEIDRVGPGGNYLAADLTLEHYREVAFDSPVFSRLSLDAWQAAGNPSAERILREHTLELLANLPQLQDHAEIIARGEALIRRLSPQG
jgi:trimethylamine---corrinoid protein Co-methyltransferase